jgi:hypothetical protein
MIKKKVYAIASVVGEKLISIADFLHRPFAKQKIP